MGPPHCPREYTPVHVPFLHLSHGAFMHGSAEHGGTTSLLTCEKHVNITCLVKFIILFKGRCGLVFFCHVNFILGYDYQCLEEKDHPSIHRLI